MQIGRATFLEQENGRRHIRKSPPPCPPVVWRRILRLLTGGSLPFQNELAITPRLSGVGLGNVKLPLLERITEQGDAIYTWLPGEERRDFSDQQIEDLLKGLVALNASRIATMLSPFRRALFRVLDAPLYLTARRLCGACGLPFLLKLRTMLVLTKSFTKVRIKSRSKVLLHNDLVFGNVLLSDDGAVGIIDFEDAIVDRAFLLSDCIDVLFDSERCSLDFAKVVDFATSLTRFGVDSGVVERVGEICRIGLIRNITHRLVSARTSGEGRARLVEFLETRLLDDRAFHDWLETQK